MFDAGKLDTTIKILRGRGLGVHADLVSKAQEEIRSLQSEPLPRSPMKPVLTEGDDFLRKVDNSKFGSRFLDCDK